MNNLEAILEFLETQHSQMKITLDEEVLTIELFEYNEEGELENESFFQESSTEETVSIVSEYLERKYKHYGKFLRSENRKSFMKFFRSEGFHETLTSDDAHEVFAHVLHGESDLTEEFINSVLSDYQSDLMVLSPKDVGHTIGVVHDVATTEYPEDPELMDRFSSKYCEIAQSINEKWNEMDEGEANKTNWLDWVQSKAVEELDELKAEYNEIR